MIVINVIDENVIDVIINHVINVIRKKEHLRCAINDINENYE